jgi:hypothetical protein
LIASSLLDVRSRIGKSASWFEVIFMRMK